MTKIKILEVLVDIRKDNFGKIIETVTNKNDYGSFIQYFENQSYTKGEIENTIRQMHISGEIEVLFDSPDDNTPYGIVATQQGIDYYLNHITASAIGFTI